MVLPWAPRWFVLSALSVWIWSGVGCQRQAADSITQPLRVFCGSSMAAPVQELVRSFEVEHGAVLLDLGGSETLLPRVLSGAPADVFVCHDPFAEKLQGAGKANRVVTVGYLRPIILVRPGNPHAIRSLADLARPGVKLGLGDPRYSTCGELFVNRLKETPFLDGVMSNAVLQARSHAELANGLILGALDAVVVWNFVARLYPGKVEALPETESYPPVRVTVVGLSGSREPQRRDAFLDWCGSARGQAVFEQHGYGPAEHSLHVPDLHLHTHIATRHSRTRLYQNWQLANLK